MRELDPAPPTKKAMLRKERELKGPEPLFKLPNVDGNPPRPQIEF